MVQIYNNMDEISGKLSELKSLFQFGGKLVPVIETIIEFLNDTVPLIDDINISIKDSTSKIPQATDQINNVNSATEMATTEILDLVDEINNQLNQSELLIEKTKNKYSENSFKLKRLHKLVENEEALKILDELLNDKSQSDDLGNILELIKKIEESTNKITLSLQVQDITSQQLEAVNHLIMNIHQQLTNMLVSLNNNEDTGNVNNELESGEHFDAKASYIKPQNSQDDVDEIVNKQLNNTSQEEIDKLFS